LFLWKSKTGTLLGRPACAKSLRLSRYMQEHAITSKATQPAMPALLLRLMLFHTCTGFASPAFTRMSGTWHSQLLGWYVSLIPQDLRQWDVLQVQHQASGVRQYPC
jgi:hypothetical protein